MQRRVINDLAAELRDAADLAVDALVEIVNNPKAKEVDRIAAAREILDRSFGKPVQGIVGDFRFDTADRITAEDLQRAALRVATHHAEDILA